MTLTGNGRPRGPSHIPCFGIESMANGNTERCSKTFHSRSTGRFMSAMPRRAPTHAGQGSRCPPRLSGIALHMARPENKSRSVHFRGAHRFRDQGLGNFDFERWDPTPVAAFPEGKSAFGVTDLLGNAWEWTSTEFASFPGFQPFEFYPGYSANFFDGAHYVMKGGSPRTAASMLRRSFRNWFQPHYQYVYAGFRCVSK